jgi:hypothetical protein
VNPPRQISLPKRRFKPNQLATVRCFAAWPKVPPNCDLTSVSQTVHEMSGSDLQRIEPF